MPPKTNELRYLIGVLRIMNTHENRENLAQGE